MFSEEERSNEHSKCLRHRVLVTMAIKSLNTAFKDIYGYLLMKQSTNFSIARSIDPIHLTVREREIGVEWK